MISLIDHYIQYSNVHMCVNVQSRNTHNKYQFRDITNFKNTSKNKIKDDLF